MPTVRRSLPIACAVLASIVLAPPARAATVFVGNDGVDAAACGIKAAPCRSINRGLAVATSGDTILVGPGVYGDLDHDGVLSGAGEEHPNPLGFNCQCAIQIAKPVTVVSRDGAGETVIDIGGAKVNGVPLDGVRLGGAAVFGKPKKGFTVTGVAGGFTAAIRVHLLAPGTRVSGNRAIANEGFGFTIEGIGSLVEGNRAFDNQSGGFVIAGNDNVIAGNLAERNGRGFGLNGRGHVLKGNSSSTNAIGFVVMALDTASLTLLGNVAIGNTFEGFAFLGDGHVISGNAAIGNGGSGMLFEEASSSTLTVTRNTFVGNGSGVGNGAPPSNCGIDVNTVSGAPLAVSKSYWGAPTGPGDDPADRACGRAATSPFATAEIKVSPKLRPAD